MAVTKTKLQPAGRTAEQASLTPAPQSQWGQEGHVDNATAADVGSLAVKRGSHMWKEVPQPWHGDELSLTHLSLCSAVALVRCLRSPFL
jgi:hypothetical protein